MEEMILMRVKEEEGQKVITYHEALYSQLEEKHIGMKILSAVEIILEKLKSEEYAAAWEQYKRERNDNGRALEATEWHDARRLFINMLDSNVQCLIVAKDFEIRWEQPKT